MAGCHRLSGFGLPIGELLDAPERLREDPEITVALDLAEGPLGSKQASAAQRSIMSRVARAAHTARDYARAMPLGFSTMLVRPGERMSAGVSPRSFEVNISSMPCKRLAAASA